MPIGEYAGSNKMMVRCCVLNGLLVCLLAALAFFPIGARIYAQTVQIKIVDGRSGKPIVGSCVNVWVGNERKDALAIPTNETVASHR